MSNRNYTNTRIDNHKNTLIHNLNLCNTQNRIYIFKSNALFTGSSGVFSFAVLGRFVCDNVLKKMLFFSARVQDERARLLPQQL